MSVATTATPRMIQVQRGVDQWNEWRTVGGGPDTRDAALKIISGHMGLDFSRCRESLARSIKTLEGVETDVDSRLSFIVWDITQNDGALFDYSRTLDRILSDLLTEAGNLLRTYTRYRLPMNKIVANASSQIKAAAKSEAPHVLKEPRITAPRYITVNRKITSVRDISKETLERLSEEFISYAVRSLLRWKAYGADSAYIKRVLSRIEERFQEAA